MFSGSTSCIALALSVETSGKLDAAPAAYPMPAEAARAMATMITFFMGVLPRFSQLVTINNRQVQYQQFAASWFLRYRSCRKHRFDRRLGAFVILIADGSACTD